MASKSSQGSGIGGASKEYNAIPRTSPRITRSRNKFLMTSSTTSSSTRAGSLHESDSIPAFPDEPTITAIRHMGQSKGGEKPGRVQEGNNPGQEELWAPNEGVGTKGSSGNDQWLEPSGMGLGNLGEEAFPRNKGKGKEKRYGMEKCGQDDESSISLGKNNQENEQIDSVLFESTMRAMPQYMERLFKTIDPLVFLLKTCVKTDTSRYAVLLRSSEELKNSAEYLSSKIDNIPVPRGNMTEDKFKDLHFHVKRNKEVLEELGKC